MIEWNATLSGKKLDEIDKPVWLIHWKYESLHNPLEAHGEGWILQGASLSHSHDDVELGFTALAASSAERPSR